MVMRFVTVRDLRTRPGEVWALLAEVGEVVVTSNGKPIAVLTPTSEETLERSLAALRRARAAEAVDRMQRESRRRSRHRLAARDVDREILAVRRGRERDHQRDR
jgi:prevent-host-death family protein